MSTTIRWFGGAGSPEISPAASGGFNTVGFYGPGFGLSTRVGDFNETSFRTIEAGTSDGGALPNLRWANVSGAYVASEIVATELLEVNNTEATIKILLTTDSAVKTQNAKLRVFDKTSINNDPSGVTCYSAEIAKDQALVRGSGNTSWTNTHGSGSVLSIANQSTANFTSHSFYVGLTATPLSIGEKTQFAIYFECEFI